MASIPPALARNSCLGRHQTSRLRDVGGLDALPYDLYARKHHCPPLLRFGYPIGENKLEDYALAHGYKKKTFKEMWFLSTGEDKDEDDSDMEDVCVDEWPYIEEFVSEHIYKEHGYTVSVCPALRNGEDIDMFVFYSNFTAENERVVSEEVKRFYEAFSDAPGEPKWYPDLAHFIWNWKYVR